MLSSSLKNLESKTMVTRIIRPVHGRIEVRGLPKSSNPVVSNKQWFKNSLNRNIQPLWVEHTSNEAGYGHWEIARAHLKPVAEAIVRREGAVLLELHFRRHEVCDTRC